MRDIDITEECLEFIDSQDQRVVDKFFQLIEVISMNVKKRFAFMDFKKNQLKTTLKQSNGLNEFLKFI